MPHDKVIDGSYAQPIRGESRRLERNPPGFGPCGSKSIYLHPIYPCVDQ